MLNIWKNKKNFTSKPLYTFGEKVLKDNLGEYKIKGKTQDKWDKDEYKNTIFYPSNKEWGTSIYSYNKSYIKSLISLDISVSDLFISYLNMVEDKIKLLFKRRRTNKIRYSADRIYLSRPEFKHTINKITIILYIFNKQKLSVERFLIQVLGKGFEKVIAVKVGEKALDYKNKLLTLLKKRLLLFKKWKNVFFSSDKLVKHRVLNLKWRHVKLYNISMHDLVWSKKGSKLEQRMSMYDERINYNKLKFSDLLLNQGELGLTSILEKIYNKNIEIKLVNLKSIHLNSDVFSSAIALKLRDRKNKAVRILRKAILQMTNLPDLHTIRTFDDRVENIDQNNIINTIKQQVVTGVRFEASGRLTRRLTAMRSVFKYRYVGSLKNLRSSLNNKSSTILRGTLKSNAQYTVINSKTRNGSFGLKGWVSGHFISFPVISLF